MKKTRLTTPRRLTMTLMLLMLTAMTAWAEDIETYYVDANGKTHNITATVLTGNESKLGTDGQTTWYVVNNNISHSGQVTCRGDVNIILADGATMTTSSDNGDGIGGNSGSLTIYGQTEGTGTLDVTATGSGDMGIMAYGGITINGGTVSTMGKYSGIYSEWGSVTINGGTVSATGEAQGINSNRGGITISGGTVTATGDEHGIYSSQGDITISGGTVTATGGTNGIYALESNITISGGKVTATGNDSGIKVDNFAGSGSIILSWTNATDFIKVSSYAGTVKVTDGLAFLTDDTTPVQVSGTVSDLSLINNKKLTPDVSSAFKDNGDGTYTIYNAYGWDVFCDQTQTDENLRVFSGKTVYLGADISVSRAAGDGYAFTGIFDGQGHTLRFSINTEGSNSRIGVAPFHNVRETKPTGSSEVSHPAIRNLNVVADITTGRVNASGLVAKSYNCSLTIEGCTVSGTIRTSNYGAGGFIGELESKANVTITNCVSSITIIDNRSGGVASNGGFVGEVSEGDNLHFEGCLFNGKLLTTTNGKTCGGFVGNNNKGTVTVTNCVYAPAALAQGETWEGTTLSATFVRNYGGHGEDGVAIITNSYYTQEFNDGTDQTGQGKQLRSITTDKYATVAQGTATVYPVSGITGYGPGIKYGDVLYAGYGDLVNLALVNPGTDAPVGYVFNFTASAGTLIGSTLDDTKLEMPNEDVTVTALHSTGQAVDVSYIKADGTSGTHAAIALEGTESSLGEDEKENWYFIGANISHNGQIQCLGDVNIILGDGATMTASNNDTCISGTSGSLTIYGQTIGTGTLTVIATNVGGTAYAIYSDNVNILGGTVTAKATSGMAYAIYGNNVNILGGNVTANGSYAGIYSNSTITLGWTRASDRICASLYVGTVKVASGKALVDTSDGNKYYIGDGNAISASNIAGKTLKPALLLTDNVDNSAQIAALDGLKTTAILQGRTLYRDGAWNTLYLPFDLSGYGSTIFKDADVRCLNTYNKYNANGEMDNDNGKYETGQLDADGTMHIYFVPMEPMFANSPYIVKWNKADNYDETPLDIRDIVNPVFTNVTVLYSDETHDITSWEGGNQFGNLSFVSTGYGPVAIPVNDKSRLFLGDANQLYWPNKTNRTSFPYVTTETATTVAISPDIWVYPIPHLTADSDLDKYYYVGPCRGYFRLNNGLTVGDGTTAVRGFSLNLGEEDETTTGVALIDNGKWIMDNEAGAWYDLSGRKLDTKPTKKGVYIRNGKKIVIK